MPLSPSQRTTGRRVTRRLLVAVMALVVATTLVLVADAVVRDRIADRIAVQVGGEVGAVVDVRLGGLLPGLQALVGQVPVVDLTADDVAVGDPPVRLDQLSVQVTDLVVEGDTPVAGEGTFRALVSQAAVRDAAPAELAPLLSLDGDALLVGVGPLSVPLVLAATGEALVVSLPGEVPLLGGLLADGLQVPLDVPDGVAVTGASVVGGQLLLTGTLDPVVVASAS